MSDADPGAHRSTRKWNWRLRGQPSGALHGADARATRHGDEPTLTLVCADSFPLGAPVINGVATPNAHTLTALTGAGGILKGETDAQKSELLIGYVLTYMLYKWINWLN